MTSTTIPTIFRQPQSTHLGINLIRDTSPYVSRLDGGEMGEDN